MDGDVKAFRRLVEPHLDELMTAARRDIAYYRALGDLVGNEITAQDLVDETLLRAWQDRFRRPRHIGLRAWLLGTQHRVLQRFLRRLRLEKMLIAVSLEAPYPPEEPIYDDEESFWEWYQPDDVVLWEDAIPDETMPAEPIVEIVEEEAEEMRELEPQARKILSLADYHQLALEEIAWIMNLSVKRTTEILEQARQDTQQKREGST